MACPTVAGEASIGAGHVSHRGLMCAGKSSSCLSVSFSSRRTSFSRLHEGFGNLDLVHHRRELRSQLQIVLCQVLKLLSHFIDLQLQSRVLRRKICLVAHATPIFECGQVGLEYLQRSMEVREFFSGLACSCQFANQLHRFLSFPGFRPCHSVVLRDVQFKLLLVSIFASLLDLLHRLLQLVGLPLHCFHLQRRFLDLGLNTPFQHSDLSLLAQLFFPPHLGLLPVVPLHLFNRLLQFSRTLIIPDILYAPNRSARSGHPYPHRCP